MSGIKNRWLEILYKNDPFNRTEYNEALAHVRQNFMEIHNDDSFWDLEREVFCEILDSDDLNVENEEMVFDTVRHWLSFNYLDPETHLKPLLRVVRFSLLPIKYLFDEVEPFVNPIQDCREVFLDVLRYHLNHGEIKMNIRLRKYQNTSQEMIKITKKCGIIPKTEKPGVKLLSIGSDCLNSANVIEIYDNVLNQWIKPNNLEIYRRNYSVAIIDGKVILIGGTRYPDENTKSLKIVQFLDLSTGQLTMEASLNDARQYSAAVVIGKGKSSFLYVLGGRGNEDDLDSVERWDPLSRVWTFTQPMLSKRTGLAAAILNGKIYVVGGKINMKYTNTMEAYSLEDAEWETKASMKEARAHFCVAVFKDFLYAVAGCKEHQLHLNTVEKYNHFDDSWVTIANIVATGQVGISSLGNKLICAGGKCSKSVLEYNDESDKWSVLEEMHVPRAGYLLELPREMNDLQFDWNVPTMSYSNKLLMIGNWESKNIKLEVYDYMENQWTRLNDLNIRKTRYSVVCFGETLLMIGGLINDNSVLNAVESLNIRTGEVSQTSPLHHCRQDSAAVVTRLGKLAVIYVFGGMRDGKFLESVERWDSSTRTWTIITPMTVGRTGHGAVVLENEIYVIGGKTRKTYLPCKPRDMTYDKTVEAYDFKNDRWSTKASMNNANGHFGITTFKNCIFVVGGYRDFSNSVKTVEFYDPKKDVWTMIANISSSGTVGISSLGNKLICAGGNSSNSVEEYNVGDNRWNELSSLNNKYKSSFLIELRSDIEICSRVQVIQKRSSNKLVFFGTEKYEGGDIEKFEVVNKKWTTVKNLPLYKKNFNVNLIDNKFLIIGGNVDKHGFTSVDAIDLSSGTINSLPSLKEPRFHASSVVVQDGNKEVVYVLGGSNNNYSNTSVEIWDPSKNEWTEGIPMTVARSAHGCAFLNGKIYVVGGFVKGKSSKTMEAFDIKSGGTWKTKASMNKKRGEFGITTFKNFIYVAGGFDSISSVERYDPVSDSWTTLTNIKSSGTVALCSIGDKLICAGGNENHVEEYDVANNIWITLSRTNNKIKKGYLLELPENAILGHW